MLVDPPVPMGVDKRPEKWLGAQSIGLHKLRRIRVGRRRLGGLLEVKRLRRPVLAKDTSDVMQQRRESGLAISSGHRVHPPKVRQQGWPASRKGSRPRFFLHRRRLGVRMGPSMGLWRYYPARCAGAVGRPRPYYWSRGSSRAGGRARLVVLLLPLSPQLRGSRLHPYQPR